MIKLTDIINEENYIRGLYQAQVGDPIWIGRQGDLGKNRSTISKILPNGNVVDERGNIFLPNGRLYKGGKNDITHQKQFNKGKEISAQLITQKEFDKNYKQIKIDFLRKFDWEKMNIEDLEKIIDQLPVKQGNTLNKSRFEK